MHIACHSGARNCARCWGHRDKQRTVSDLSLETQGETCRSQGSKEEVSLNCTERPHRSDNWLKYASHNCMNMPPALTRGKPGFSKHLVHMTTWKQRRFWSGEHKQPISTHSAFLVSPLVAAIPPRLPVSPQRLRSSSTRKILIDFLLTCGLFGQYDSSQLRWELLLMPHCHRTLRLEGPRGHTAPSIFQIGKQV